MIHTPRVVEPDALVNLGPRAAMAIRRVTSHRRLQLLSPLHDEPILSLDPWT